MMKQVPTVRKNHKWKLIALNLLILLYNLCIRNLGKMENN